MLEEQKELLRSVLISKSAMLDRSSEKEVGELNKLQKQLVNLYLPGREKENENIEKSMTEVFSKLFRTKDGKTKSLDVKLGKEYGKDVEFDNYLKNLKKDK